MPCQRRDYESDEAWAKRLLLLDDEGHGLIDEAASHLERWKVTWEQRKQVARAQAARERAEAERLAVEKRAEAARRGWETRRANAQRAEQRARTDALMRERAAAIAANHERIDAARAWVASLLAPPPFPMLAASGVEQRFTLEDILATVRIVDEADYLGDFQEDPVTEQVREFTWNL